MMLYIALGSLLLGSFATALVFTHNSKRDVTAAYYRGLRDGQAMRR